MRMLAVFRKGERLRHIGHLDIMRAMQRALRRSGMPVAYSKGFNPHILLTFASALSVGAVGEREVMDVTMAQEIDPESFLSAMNAALPPDMQLLEARAVDDRHPALMAQVRAARYSIRLLDESAADCVHAVPALLARTEISAERKTKSGVKTCDIRPWIHELSAEGDTLHALLALTETENCKPDMLVEALASQAGCPKPRYLAVREALLGLSAGGGLAPVEAL